MTQQINSKTLSLFLGSQVEDIDIVEQQDKTVYAQIGMVKVYLNKIHVDHYKDQKQKINFKLTNATPDTSTNDTGVQSLNNPQGQQ